MENILPDGAPSGLGLKEELAAVERKLIGRQLLACNGDYGMAAKQLGISRVSLWRKLGGAKCGTDAPPR